MGIRCSRGTRRVRPAGARSGTRSTRPSRPQRRSEFCARPSIWGSTGHVVKAQSRSPLRHEPTGCLDLRPLSTSLTVGGRRVAPLDSGLGFVALPEPARPVRPLAVGAYIGAAKAQERLHGVRCCVGPNGACGDRDGAIASPCAVLLALVEVHRAEPGPVLAVCRRDDEAHLIAHGAFGRRRPERRPPRLASRLAVVARRVEVRAVAAAPHRVVRRLRRGLRGLARREPGAPSSVAAPIIAHPATPASATRPAAARAVLAWPMPRDSPGPPRRATAAIPLAPVPVCGHRAPAPAV